MLEIKLKSGHMLLIDDIDSDLMSLKWHALSSMSKGHKKRYVARRNKTSLGRKYVYIHRIILARILGRELAANEFVDHIDMNPFNNTRSNLRLATKAENSRNRRGSNPPGYKGVTKRYSRWSAAITVNYKRHYLGTFDTPEEAYQAYCEAAKKLHGEFARLE